MRLWYIFATIFMTNPGVIVMEALYPILIVLGVGALIGSYITYRYLKNKHARVVEDLEIRNKKSLAAEIEEKEEVIEKYIE